MTFYSFYNFSKCLKVKITLITIIYDSLIQLSCSKRTMLMYQNLNVSQINNLCLFPVCIMHRVHPLVQSVVFKCLTPQTPPRVAHSPLCFCTTPDPILITSHSSDITMAKSRKCIWAAGKRPLQRQAADICRDSRGVGAKT